MVTSRAGTPYYLKQTQPGRSGARRVYYFSPNFNASQAASLPDGFEVAETRTGLPILRRKLTARARII